MVYLLSADRRLQDMRNAAVKERDRATKTLEELAGMDVSWDIPHFRNLLKEKSEQKAQQHAVRTAESQRQLALGKAYPIIEKSALKFVDRSLSGGWTGVYSGPTIDLPSIFDKMVSQCWWQS